MLAQQRMMQKQLGLHHTFGGGGGGRGGGGLWLCLWGWGLGWVRFEVAFVRLGGTSAIM